MFPQPREWSDIRGVYIGGGISREWSDIRGVYIQGVVGYTGVVYRWWYIGGGISVAVYWNCGVPTFGNGECSFLEMGSAHFGE